MRVMQLLFATLWSILFLAEIWVYLSGQPAPWFAFLLSLFWICAVNWLSYLRSVDED